MSFNLSLSSRQNRIITHLVLALLIYASWHWPRSMLGAVLAIFSALLLAFLSRDGKQLSHKSCYFSGLIVNILGFYWLAETIQRFGGFPAYLSWLIFGFFVLVSSFQFLVFAFFFNRLPLFLGPCRLALAWVSTEFLCPRIFPWELATPLLGLPLLTQIADIAGSPSVSFTMLTASSLFVSIFYSTTTRSKLSLGSALIALLVSWCGYGYYKINMFSAPYGTALKLAIIQANVAVVQQGDTATIRQNKQRYIELSQQVSPSVELIVWPEAVLQDWMQLDTRRIEDDDRLPVLGPNVSLLSGALTFETRERFFNSAVLFKKDGSIPPPYHKRILMPFGEYMPFASIFPWLNTINVNLALFTAGNSQVIFEVPSDTPARISPLICYEDLIPRLSRSATQLGAEILFNLTNDAWFGDGPAAVHHSLIASFRAIENRRFLVRSTNTGLSEIINPIGISVGQIQPNSEGVLEAEVSPVREMTLFTEIFGPWLWWLVGVLTTAVAVFRTKARS